MSLVFVVKIIFTIKKNLKSVRLSIINKSVLYQVNLAFNKLMKMKLLYFLEM